MKAIKFLSSITMVIIFLTLILYLINYLGIKKQEMFYKENCSSISTEKILYDCVEQDFFQNKQEEKIKYLRGFAAENHPKAQYFFYLETIDVKNNEELKKEGAENLKKCATSYYASCINLYLKSVKSSSDLVKDYVKKCLALNEINCFNYLIYEDRFKVLEKKYVMGELNRCAEEQTLGCILKLVQLEPESGNINNKKDFFKKCALKNYECLIKILQLNYKKSNVELNNFFIIYYKDSQEKRYVDYPLLSYREYLKNNDIPKKDTVYCVIYRECE